MSIGRALADLQGDFPDVSISKIRFLEAEGLVTPQRTASGYRTFSGDDVERLRYILTAQRDRFWPLKVIREALDAIDRGLTPPTGPTQEANARPRPPQHRDDPDLPTVEQLATPSSLRLTARELREAAELDVATFEALKTFGLLRADGDGHFDGDALTVTSGRSARPPTGRSGWCSRSSGPLEAHPPGAAPPTRPPRSCASASPCTRPSSGAACRTESAPPDRAVHRCRRG